MEGADQSPVDQEKEQVDVSVPAWLAAGLSPWHCPSGSTSPSADTHRTVRVSITDAPQTAEGCDQADTCHEADDCGVGVGVPGGC
jgi:hypothetical protein